MSVGTGGGAEPSGTADSCAAMPGAPNASVRTKKAPLTRTCRIISELDGENTEMFPLNSEPEDAPFQQGRDCRAGAAWFGLTGSFVHDVASPVLAWLVNRGARVDA